MNTNVKTFNLLKIRIFYVIKEKEKENVSLMERSLHEYVLFSVHVILLSTVLPGIYPRRNIPITNKEQLHKPHRHQDTSGMLIELLER
jgi:hypothetical protein